MSMSNTNKRVKEIRRKTRRKFSPEEKIRIVLDGYVVTKINPE
jgi:transposase